MTTKVPKVRRSQQASVNEFYGPRTPIHLTDASKQTLLQYAESPRQVYVVLVSRSDSDWWVEQSRIDDERLEWLGSHASLDRVVDQWVTATDRLRIWEVKPD